MRRSFSANKSKLVVPIAYYYRAHLRTAIKVKYITDTPRNAITLNYHRTDIHMSEISARSLRAGGAMVMMCRKIDMNNIHMMGWWYSDTMMQYLHVQAQPSSSSSATCPICSTMVPIPSNPTKLSLSLTVTPTYKKQPERYALSQPTLSIWPMGKIPVQRHPAISVTETERPIRQRPGIRMGGDLVNHIHTITTNLLHFYNRQRRQAEYLVKRLHRNLGIKLQEQIQQIWSAAGRRGRHSCKMTKRRTCASTTHSINHWVGSERRRSHETPQHKF
jgi:hypothetical protein